MKIAVVGTGYVGLVTGTCFAETGNVVTCVDIDQAKVDSLKSGVITIYEPGLEVLFKKNLEQGNLKFTTHLAEGIKDAQVIFLALPTPPGEDGSADLKYILKVADDLGPILENYTVIIDKSTVPVGTAEKVHARIAAGAKVDFDVVSNPEFLREGVAVDDFMKPDRVVVGTTSPKAKVVMEKLYAPLVRSGNPVIFMDERSAEMTKYAANAFLATKITFMNEIANLCELAGADVEKVRIGVGSDNRIGKRFLFPGIGYGGSCFPKDVQALHKTAADHQYNFRILDAVMDVNHDQKTKLIPRIKNYFGDLTGKTIAMWGLSFKPYTDDIREAPSLYNIEELLAAGAKVRAYDPEGLDNVKRLLGDKIEYSADKYGCLEGADALLLVTEWNEFRSADFEYMAKKLKSPVIFDGRNQYELEEMQAAGYDYFSIGRRDVRAFSTVEA